MVEHVRRRAKLARTVDEVIVATCDQEIADIVRAAGGTVVLTADTHKRCTTRVEEASRGLTADIVVIVQGDEPLIVPEAIDAAVAPLLLEPTTACTNVLTRLGRDDRGDVSVVKAALDQHGRVLFLTRAAIPHEVEPTETPVYRQTGLMAFTRSALARYADLPETPLERAESVDMLRFIEHGVPVMGVVFDFSSIGIDYPEHIAVAERILLEDEGQRALHERIRTGPLSPA